MSSKIKPWIDLCRVSNLPTVWTNVLAATVLTGVAFQWGAAVVVAAAMSLLYSGGMALNDIFDEKIDRKERPGRPIPSGKIKKQIAILLVVGLFAAALLLLATSNYKMKAVLSALTLIALIAIYDARHKQFKASVLIMAACRAMVFITTAIYFTGTVEAKVLVAAAIQYAYTVAVSVTARYENKREHPFAYPVIPTMIAGMSLVDGILMALWGSPYWLLVGVAGALLTRFGQKFVRGD